MRKLLASKAQPVLEWNDNNIFSKLTVKSYDFVYLFPSHSFFHIKAKLNQQISQMLMNSHNKLALYLWLSVMPIVQPIYII